METTTTSASPQQAPAPKRFAVGVQFRPAGRISTYATTDPSLVVGDRVVVEAQGGTLLGSVIVPPREAGEFAHDTPKVLHLAHPTELEAEARRGEQVLEFAGICRTKIREHALPMKLLDAQIEEGGRKIVFSFFAEHRVDFRALVKDLAVALRMRIEMRQVGSRDESKLRGCLGPCGLATCCSLHLRQFQSISISMAKHQGLAPNPAKLTGLCNKLKCCLAYEHAVYDEYRQGLPKMGAAVASPKGAGKVVGHNVLKRECTVRLFGGGELRCPCDTCQPLTAGEREAALEAARRAEEESEERARLRRERRGGRENGRDRRAGKREEKKG